MPPAQSERKRRVLFLSNGHAEDLIAATIIEKLIGECSYCEIRALPLLGEAISIVEARGEAVAEEIYSILTHPQEKKEALEVGKERRGVRSFYADILYYLCLQ
ncbi:hypothetical protein ES702_03338 [subsurface metagenome]